MLGVFCDHPSHLLFRGTYHYPFHLTALFRVRLVKILNKGFSGKNETWTGHPEEGME